MSFIKIFKNKKNGAKNTKRKNGKEIKKSLEKNIGAEKTGDKPIALKKQKAEYISAVYELIDFPHITEKSANLAVLNKYVFRVFPRANKKMIAKNIAGFYGVKVESVNIINIHRKKRFLRRREGYKNGYKKAIVTLRKGDKIDVLSH